MSIQKIGIDKLTLTGRDFSVIDASNRQLAIDDRKKQGRQSDDLPYLLTDSTGRQIYAHAIYHNTTALNVSINPKGLNISFNPNKIINPYELSEINSAGFNDSIKITDEHLQKIGIKLNMQNLKLYRVDLAKQQEMKHEIFEYNPAFRLLSSKATMKQRAYLETHTIGNTLHQACFYDKEQELSDAGIHSLMKGEKNFMRAEIRFLKTQSTQRNLHAETLADFRKLQAPDISDIYSLYMNKNIFNSAKISQQMQFQFHDEIEIYKYLKQLYPYQVVSKRLAITEIDEYLIKINGIAGFTEILKAAGYNRMQISREKKRMQELISLKAEIDKKTNKISVASLLDELKLKFAA
jgi:hypothetical protein